MSIMELLYRLRDWKDGLRRPAIDRSLPPELLIVYWLNLLECSKRLKQGLGAYTTDKVDRQSGELFQTGAMDLLLE